jgi:glutathione S-transferase
MILVGQYDSPFARRVAISLAVLGFPFERDTRSVFADFESMRLTNPLGRIPSLILDDGTVLVDSWAIRDWLDHEVGPERALVPASGLARREALQTIALAAGGIEKIGAANYERLMRPAHLHWPQWIERCRVQGAGAFPALERRNWHETRRLDQMQITTVCLVSYARVSDPDLMPRGRYPALDALADRCEALPEFAATRIEEYVLPGGDR